jgi:hypothetical protein
MRLLAIAFCFFLNAGTGSCQSLITPFEKSAGMATATYRQGIAWWYALAKKYPTQVRILIMGSTDSGEPLRLVVFSPTGNFNMGHLHASGSCFILVNNAIHPGEPDGVDASMLLARDLAEKKIFLSPDVTVAFIPFYNIGGALNRGSFSRASQDGPLSYGFRGNARNLDLNRDFIKSDSRNAISFARIFHLVNPDIFIDNHVSDGADYQHVMTLLSTQHDKLGPVLGPYLKDRLEPALYALMKQKGFDLVPYVNDPPGGPDSGWVEFYDSPRYSTGYAALFGTFGFMPETHMLKPYAQRVASDYALLSSFLIYANIHGHEIVALRARALRAMQEQQYFPLDWMADHSRWDSIDFKGYKALWIPSRISGFQRLYYDHNQPYEKRIPFYDDYLPTDSVQKPDAYIIPQGWWDVINLLQANGVKMSRIATDTLLRLGYYHIDSYRSATRPYEKHHANYGVTATERRGLIPLRKGDYFIPLGQEADRYLVETLEPEGKDGFFAWNFFDAILQEKEGFAAYTFEDRASVWLDSHPTLADSLRQARKEDPQLAKSGSAQLEWVYRHSPWFEPAYLRYPVYRYYGNNKVRGLFFNHRP